MALRSHKRHAPPTGLPDCLNSCRLEAAIACDQYRAEVKRSRGDDAVGHIRNDIARNLFKGIGDEGIHGGDVQSSVRVSEGITQPLKRCGRYSLSFHEVNDFDDRNSRHEHVAGFAIASSITVRA